MFDNSNGHLPPPLPPNPYLLPTNSPPAFLYSDSRMDLRRLSRAGGCALLLVCALQQIVAPVTLLRRFLPGVSGVIWEGFSYLLISVFAVMPGALLGLRMLTPREHNLALPFRRPRNEPAEIAGPWSRLTSIKIIFAGAFLCLLSNMASSLIGVIAGRFGYGFVGPESQAPTTMGSFLFMLLTVGVVPALTEEILMRGMIMQPLRRYGDGFALVCSAALFALLHQNMVQAPMAFCSGLVLGWAAIRTGSLWVPILIHMWNNAASVILQALEKPLGETGASHAMMIYAITLALLGIVSLFALWIEHRAQAAKNRFPQAIPAGKRALLYFFGSPAMVLVLLFFFVIFALGVRTN